MKVFVIVVTYNGSHWVDFCFGSLRESIHPIQTIVVDNNSSDDTVALILKKYPEVELICNQENLGFGGANNKAISLALQQGADYIMLLNQDAAIGKYTIEQLINAAEQNKDFGIISPLHCNGGGTGFDSGFANWIKKKYPDGFGSSERSVVHPVEFINAAAWMVSRECFERVGGFNPFFFHYGEDSDYVHRVKYHGLKIGFVTSCKIFHDRDFRDPAISFSSFEKIVWYYSTGLGVRLNDVNHSFSFLIIESLFWSAKELIAHFFKGRRFAFRAWFSVWIEVTKKIKKILNARAQTKTKSAFLFLR